MAKELISSFQEVYFHVHANFGVKKISVPAHSCMHEWTFKHAQMHAHTQTHTQTQTVCQ